MKIGWTGPNNEGDFITVVPPDAPKGQYLQYFNAKGTNPDEASLLMPTKLGNYEIRYVTAVSNETLAKRPITVTGVTATLEVPPTAPAGSRIRVTWTGPNNESDFITVVKPDAERAAYTEYFNTKNTDPDDAMLKLPPRPGEYEVRYVTGGDARILARAKIKTEPFTIIMEAPDTAKVGTPLEFKWTGPKIPDNYFSIAKPSAEPDSYETWVRADGDDELTINVPETPGTYELRYVVPSTKRVLVKKIITVTTK